MTTADHYILFPSQEDIYWLVAVQTLHDLLNKAHHFSCLITAFFYFLPPAQISTPFLISWPVALLSSCDSLQASTQEAKLLPFCSVSFFSTSACSLASVLSFSALNRTLSSAFSLSRVSEVSANSCSLLTASLSWRLFSRCCASNLSSVLRTTNFSCRLSRHSCASCWERRSRAWCRDWTSRWSARNSLRRMALGPGSCVSADVLSALCAEPECCRMNCRRLGNVIGRSSGYFTLRCFLKEKEKKGTQTWQTNFFFLTTLY